METYFLTLSDLHLELHDMKLVIIVLVLVVTSLSLSVAWKLSSTKAKKALGAAGLSISLGFSAPSVAEARDGASSTFAAAEKAMIIAYDNFDTAKRAWKNKAQKLVLDNQQVVGEKKRALMAVNSDLGASTTALSGIKDSIQQTIDQVTAETETLKESTAASYSVADEAAAAGKRPAITAGLFRTALIGADSVADDEAIIKDLKQIRSKVEEDETLLRKVVQDLEKHINTIVTAELDTAQGAGMADAAIQGLYNMEVRPDGLIPVQSAASPAASSAAGESLVGAKLFRKGAQEMDEAQKSTWGALKKVQVDSRVANTVQQDLTKVLGKIDAELTKKADEIKVKGKSTNTNSVGKVAIKAVQAKIGTGVKTVTSSVNKLNGFNDDVNNIYTNDQKKANAKKQRKIVNGLVPALKDVASELETYESKSKETDALLMKAKQAGEKEAERFRSSYKPRP